MKLYSNIFMSENKFNTLVRFIIMIGVLENMNCNFHYFLQCKTREGMCVCEVNKMKRYGISIIINKSV